MLHLHSKKLNPIRQNIASELHQSSFLQLAKTLGNSCSMWDETGHVEWQNIPVEHPFQLNDPWDRDLPFRKSTSSWKLHNLMHVYLQPPSSWYLEALKEPIIREPWSKLTSNGAKDRSWSSLPERTANGLVVVNVWTANQPLGSRWLLRHILGPGLWHYSTQQAGVVPLYVYVWSPPGPTHLRFETSPKNPSRSIGIASTSRLARNTKWSENIKLCVLKNHLIAMNFCRSMWSYVESKHLIGQFGQLMPRLIGRVGYDPTKPANGCRNTPRNCQKPTLNQNHLHIRMENVQNSLFVKSKCCIKNTHKDFQT